MTEDLYDGRPKERANSGGLLLRDLRKVATAELRDRALRPRDQLIKETIDWYDAHLGPVNPGP